MEGAKELLDLKLCFQVVDVISAQYDVDDLAVKVDVVMKVGVRAPSTAATSDNAKAALELIDPLLAADDFQAPSKILALVRAAGAQDHSIVAAVQERLPAVQAAQRNCFDRVAPSFEKLKQAPDDPAANLAVGRFLCFSKGEWERGLPMLAKGSDSTLKQLALLDLSHPGKNEDVMRLADGWWEVGSKEPFATRYGIRQRAAASYKTVVESATGLRKALLERRIAEAEAMPAAEPARAAKSIQRSPGVFGMYKVTGGIAPFYALFVPDGKNVTSNEIKFIFNNHATPIEARGYIGRWLVSKSQKTADTSSPAAAPSSSKVDGIQNGTLNQLRQPPTVESVRSEERGFTRSSLTWTTTAASSPRLSSPLPMQRTIRSNSTSSLVRSARCCRRISRE